MEAPGNQPAAGPSASVSGTVGGEVAMPLRRRAARRLRLLSRASTRGRSPMPIPEKDQRDDPTGSPSADATPDSAEAGAHVPSAERGAPGTGRPEAGAPELSGPATHLGHPADVGETARGTQEPGVT